MHRGKILPAGKDEFIVTQAFKYAGAKRSVAREAYSFAPVHVDLSRTLQLGERAIAFDLPSMRVAGK